MDRLIQRNVIAMSGRAVEASGDVDVLLLDKTGTITLGKSCRHAILSGARRRRASILPMPRSFLAGDETPERPIHRRAREGTLQPSRRDFRHTPATFVPFSAQTRMSGVDLTAAKVRKGALEAITRLCAKTAVTTSLPSCRFLFVIFRMRAERRCWWQRMAACWKRSRLQTSSRAA